MLEIESSTPIRKPIETVVVGNNREYFSPVDKFVPDEAKPEFVESDIDEADMDIMWHGDDAKYLTVSFLDQPDFILNAPRFLRQTSQIWQEVTP